jgi:beta-glucanase (GH16 family)
MNEINRLSGLTNRADNPSRTFLLDEEKNMKKLLGFIVSAALLFGACSMASLDTSAASTGAVPQARSAVSGSNGSIDVTGMSGTSLTVSYTAGSQLNYARVYVSEGNGTGLVLAAKDMNYSSGVYSYTLSHPTFTSGAKIYICVLVNASGAEICIPQGTLATTTSWASFIYGSTSSSSTTVDTSGIVSGATYSIVAQCSGKSLDVADWSTTAGTNIQQWTLGNNQANQKWVVTSTGDGYYWIKSSLSGFCLDVSNWSTADGAQIDQWTWGNQANQKWKIESTGSGWYKLTNQNSGKVLDVSASSTADGAKIQQWTSNDSSAQRWQLTQVDSSSTGTGSSTDATTPAISGYTVAWADEFNGTSLDSTSWTCETGSGGWGNNESEYYTDRSQNVSVADGNLKITAIRENYNGSPWTSARIKTQGKKQFTFGKIQARIKMPNGTGLWPAFWMLGADISSVSWPGCGEIDIMEHINSDNTVYGTIHWDNNGHASWGQSTSNNYWNNFVVDASQYHVYSIDWTATTMSWYVDGVQYMQADITNGTGGTEEFQKPFFFLFNLAVGGTWPGSFDASTPSPATMYVDYVRVYQK